MTRKDAIEQLNGADVMLLNRKFEEFNEAINVALDALEELEKQRWISVKERLPEEDA